MLRVVLGTEGRLLHHVCQVAETNCENFWAQVTCPPVPRDSPRRADILEPHPPTPKNRVVQHRAKVARAMGSGSAPHCSFISATRTAMFTVSLAISSAGGRYHRPSGAPHSSGAGAGAAR